MCKFICSVLTSLLLLTSNAVKVKLEVSNNLPQLCFSSEDVVPKYVNAICHHRNKTYIGGFFNRVGDEQAQHFAVLNDQDNTEYLGTIGMVTSLDNVLQSSGASFSAQNASYLGIVTALECPEEEDSIFLGGVFETVTDKNDNLITVNNIVRFDTVTQLFHAIAGKTKLVNDTHIGFKQFCDDVEPNSVDPNSDSCDEDAQVTMIRSIRCAKNNGTSCDTMYVAGYFDTALGVNGTNGVAKLDFSAGPNPTVVKIGTKDDPGKGVNGLVMALEAISEDEIVFGGIYEDPIDTDIPYLINRYTPARGTRCVVNRLMRSQTACKVDNPPLLCCELIFGPVYATGRISDNDLIIGGEFVNTFDFSPNPDDPNIEHWFTPGYQNVAIVSASENDEGKMSGIGDGGSLVGGPDGDVRAIACAEYLADSDDNRCSQVIIAGSFDNWLNFTIGADLNLKKEVAFITPFHLAKLVWDIDSKSYHPEKFSIPDNAPTFNPGTDKSINSVMATSGEIYFGGESPSYGNVGKFNETGFHFIPSNAAVAAAPGSEFFDCASSSSNLALHGMAFCCRAGSFCPAGLIDVSCPDNWGFYCTSDAIGICSEGYYCPTAGEQIVCEKNHVCRTGSIAQRACEFWEICPNTGMSRPSRMSGLILGAILLVSMFTFLVIIVYVFSWRRSVGNASGDKNFHLRFNAFKRELSGRKTKDKFAGIVGMNEDDLASVNRETDEDTAGRERSSSSFITDPQALEQPEIASAVINKRELKVDIEFDDLTVELVNKKRILQGVTGKLRAGRMTAIMGPSGCGKSTFLCALTNRIRDGGKVLGKVRINGESKPLLSIQHLVGFVPQEDVMHRDLTVRENLRFYAHLKAHPQMTRNQRRAFVNEIIDILGLSHVQHSLIGDEETRGISGGQRKRVNIGIELMASPLILFLDEPTSGLDSTTTQQLIDSLEKLTQLGLTIAMVIHQPRYEVLMKIDDLILLQKGGFPVFLGETQDALPYFTGYLNKPLPKICTPADHFLDVISEDQNIEHGFAHGNICDMWLAYVAQSERKMSGVDDYQDRIIPFRFRPSRTYQAYSFFKRTFYQLMNTRVAFFTDCVLLVFAGGMVGIVSVEELQAYQLTMMTTGLFAVVNSLKVFGPENIVFMRETSAGISTFAYFAGKVLAHLVQILLNPIFFLGLYYRTAYPSVPFWIMYKVVLATQFSCSGLGYLISVICGRKNMQIAGVLTALVVEMLSGLNPTKRTLDGFIAGKIGLLASFGPWTMGALLIKQTMGSAKALYPVYVGQLDLFGYLNIDNSTLIDEASIDGSKVALDAEYYENVNQLYKQYIFYSCLAYLVMMSKGKGAAGMLGLDSLLYLVRVEFADPLLAFLSTGKFERENLTKREKIVRRQSLGEASVGSGSGGSGGWGGGRGLSFGGGSKNKKKKHMEETLLAANSDGAGMGEGRIMSQDSQMTDVTDLTDGSASGRSVTFGAKT